MKKTFKKEYLMAVVDGDEGEIVADELTGTSRWSTEHTLIFRVPTGELYRTTYRRGATESQEESPFEYGPEDVPCTQVEAYEKTVTAYREVTRPTAPSE